jgi:hypothetical protein
MPMTDPVPTPTDRASVSDLLEAAVRVWRVTLPKCLPLAMVAIICIQLANLYWLAHGHPVPVRDVPDDTTYQMLLAAGSLCYLVLISALVVRQRALVAGAGAQLPQELRLALRRLPVLLGTLLLAALAMAVAGVVLGTPLVKLLGEPLGLGLLMLPMLFPLMCCVVLVPVVMFEPLGPVAAVRRCVRLVQPMWWKVCAAVIIGWLVVAVCAVVLAALMSLGMLLAGGKGAAVQAVATAVQVGAAAIVAVFFSALWIVLYSAASSSA